jgi:peptidyl-prolyl cis-trans isomerase A (cyclophilin A)
MVNSSVVFAQKVDDGSQIQQRNSYPRVQFETSMGNFVVELSRRKAPITVNNFLRYTDKGMYNNTLFHRVIPGFVVQGGGYNLEFEEKVAFDPIFNEAGNGMKNKPYTIAMARQNDPHSAKRQFFFNLADNESLDPGRRWGYTVFGNITEGTDVIDTISQAPTGIDDELGLPDVPLEPIVIKKVTILTEL